MEETGYCVKCRKKGKIKNAKKVTKKKRNMMRGSCPKCKTTMVKFCK